MKMSFSEEKIKFVVFDFYVDGALAQMLFPSCFIRHFGRLLKNIL
jgi:hypothetical protein